MEYINKTDFLNYVKKSNIKIEESSQSYFLTLGSGEFFRKSWVIPMAPSGAANVFFFSKILENVDSWEKSFIFKTNGRWEPFGPSMDVWANLIHKLGVPKNFEGAIEYDKSDLVDLLSMIYIQTSFTWCGADEFFIVFNHAQQLIFVDDAHALHVEFADKDRLGQFVAALSKHNYPPQEK